MLRTGCSCLLLFFALGCSATRKISQVGLREPASVKEEVLVSATRANTVAMAKFPKTCPREIAHFSFLAGERVLFPPCPSGFQETVQESLPFLNVEERTVLEEVASSQCRSLANSDFEDSMENLLLNFDTTGPLGRKNRLATDGGSDEETLDALRADLKELVTLHLPLDRWIRRNGEFLLPDEELLQLQKLIVENKCGLVNQDVDQGYRTIRGLEEIGKILQPGPQKTRVQEFILGVHKVIEQKLKEFFYP